MQWNQKKGNVQKIIIHPDRIEVKLNFDIRTGCFEEEIKKEPLNPTDQSEHSKEFFYQMGAVLKT